MEENCTYYTVYHLFEPAKVLLQFHLSRLFKRGKVLVHSSVAILETIILYYLPFFGKYYHLLLRYLRKIIVTIPFVAYNNAFFYNTFRQYCYPTIHRLHENIELFRHLCLYYVTTTFFNGTFQEIQLLYHPLPIQLPSSMASLEKYTYSTICNLYIYTYGSLTKVTWEKLATILRLFYLRKY
jgi:hypothetical protein